MASPEDLLAQKNKLQQEILALENSLGNNVNIADLLSSDSDSSEASEDSGHAEEDVIHEDLEAERQQIQREIEDLERRLGVDAALVKNLTESEHGSQIDSNEEDSDEDLDLPQDLETCLQMNLVYQEVLKEKLADLERLLNENREQQKEIEDQLSGPSYTNPGLPHLRIFLGTFMKPYFKDKNTGLGPPSNEETKERMTHGTKPCDERKIKRWESWQKTLLINSVVTDTMKRMLQPKLTKIEYLTTKMSKAQDAEKEELQKQMTLLEKDITEIRSMKEDQLYGNLHDDHDWDKIANIDFEGRREADDLMRFWQNYLHPSINKSTWSEDEIAKLEKLAEEYNCSHWDQIAEALGTHRSAFMCFQAYQRFISKRFRKREWDKNEDKVFKELVEKMRIGNFIPYTQISYFMEGRDNNQLSYRWTCVLDPSIKKGPWTKEEDELLRKAVEKYGCKEWWKIKMEVPGRTDNACRDRYLDSLRTDIKRGTWSDEEVELLRKMVEKHGVGKWAKIAAEIPNRVDSQCLNKWKWIMQTANRKNVKRPRVTRRKGKLQPQLKRRRLMQKEPQKGDDDFHTESDTSEDEKEKVSYVDSDAEHPVENASSDEECRLEYIQPDLKTWIPVHGNNMVNSPRELKTTLIRVPTEVEERAKGCVRNTVVDKLGNPVKTCFSIEPHTLQKWNSSTENALLMVSESNVKRFLTYMRTSVMKRRPRKIKTSFASCTNQNGAKNDEAKSKSEMESDQSRESNPVPKVLTSTQLSYELLLAITPWVGNVLMPLPPNAMRICEADIVQKRAADVPLPKSPVFLFFLQALKVDAEGCKKVIEARNKMSLSQEPASRPCSAKAATPNSYYHVKTVLNILEKTKHKKDVHQETSQLLPQPAKIAIPRLPQQQKKTKRVTRSASQKRNAAVKLPKTFVVTHPNTHNKVSTSHNVVEGILPLVLMGTQNASDIPQPILHVVVPEESGKVTEPASCPTTSLSTTGPAPEEANTSKRKRKPTIKAQALMDNKKNKNSKKQATKIQQNNSVTQTVSVTPQSPAWILSFADLMPGAKIEVQAPSIPGNRKVTMPNKVQVVFQPTVIVNQSNCAAHTNTMRPRKTTADLPKNKTLIAGSALGQNPRPSSVLDKHSVSWLPSSSNVISLPTYITESRTKDLPSEMACNQNKPLTPMNPRSPLVLVSSPLVGTKEKTTQSCTPIATNDVSNDSSVSAGTNTPVIPSVQPLNIVVPSSSPGSQKRMKPQPVSQVVFKEPITINQNGSLALNTADSHQTNLSLKINKSQPSSSSAGSSASLPQPLIQKAPKAKKQTVQTAATTSNTHQKQVAFDPSLMFFEQTSQVKYWIKGNHGITLPGLKDKMPYLPPFVSSINTLTTLLKGRDSLLRSAVQLLPEEQRENSEEDIKIAAVRKMVSERFKTNQAYLLLKARFLSCFTLPAFLATINPCPELVGSLDQEDSTDGVQPKENGDDHLNQLESLLDKK